jgi:hypothetical protein
MQDLEHAIRERAYHLWIADGCRDGNADSHWLNAQLEVLTTSFGTIARVTMDDPQPMKSVKKKPVRKATAKSKRRAA